MSEGLRVSEPPLRTNRGFQLLWSASAFSILGLEMADVVWPLVILGVTGSPASAGAFGAVQLITSLVLGLPAGELTDRFDRRRLMAVTDGVRALCVASVGLALLLDRLTLPHLLLVAVIIGAARPISGTCRMLLVRSVVPRSQLTAALTSEEVRNNTASLVGPALGGVLYGIATVLPFGVVVGLFSLSALFVLMLRARADAPTTPPPRDAAPLTRRMMTGLEVLWRTADLRRTTLFTTAMNTATAPLVLIVVVHLSDQDVPSGLIGVAIAGLAVGGLAGAVLVRPLRRFSPGVLMLVQALSVAILLCMLGLPLGPWGAGLLLVALMLGVPTMRILVDLVIFRQVPDEQRGRVASAAGTVWALGAAAGTLLSGLALGFFSARTTLLAIAACVAVVFVGGLLSPGFRSTRWPADV